MADARTQYDWLGASGFGISVQQKTARWKERLAGIPPLSRVSLKTACGVVRLALKVSPGYTTYWPR